MKILYLFFVIFNYFSCQSYSNPRFLLDASKINKKFGSIFSIFSLGMAINKPHYFISTFGDGNTYNGLTSATEFNNTKLCLSGYSNKDNLQSFVGIYGLKKSIEEPKWYSGEFFSQNSYYLKCIESKNSSHIIIGLNKTSKETNLIIKSIKSDEKLDWIQSINSLYNSIFKDTVLVTQNKFSVGGYFKNQTSSNNNIVITNHNFTDYGSIIKNETRIYENINDLQLNKMIKTTEGNIVFVGSTYGSIYGKDILVCKENLNYTINWCKQIRGKNDEEIYSLKESEFGVILLTGYTESLSDNIKKSILVKIHLNGTILEISNINSNYEIETYAIDNNANNDIFLAGYIKKNNLKKQPILIKINNDTSYNWGQIYNKFQYDSSIISIHLNQFSDIVIGGYADQNVKRGSQKILLGKIPSSAIWNDCNIENFESSLVDVKSSFILNNITLSKHDNININTKKSEVKIKNIEINNNDICTVGPTLHPTSTTQLPTKNPSISPSHLPTYFPSILPTESPTNHTNNPTVTPSIQPTMLPSINPTSITSFPSLIPTKFPSKAPSKIPTEVPTSSPSIFPSEYPSISPSTNTSMPSISPSHKPSYNPTEVPILSIPLPTLTPTLNTSTPSLILTYTPSVSPTIEPSFTTTSLNTNDPTYTPSGNPIIVNFNDLVNNSQVNNNDAINVNHENKYIYIGILLGFVLSCLCFLCFLMCIKIKEKANNNLAFQLNSSNKNSIKRKIETIDSEKQNIKDGKQEIDIEKSISINENKYLLNQNIIEMSNNEQLFTNTNMDNNNNNEEGYNGDV